jgi:oligopeptide transport system substrate-binding protein
MSNTMKRWVVALLALALVVTSAVPAFGQDRILHRGNLAEPDTLDPQKFFTTYEGEILRDMYLGLLQIDAKAEAIPGAAESWTVSDDGLTYTFRLRPDGKWSDGAPVTAQDFLMGFRRAFDPKTASPYANFGYVIRNAKAITSGGMTADQLGVRVIDPLTLEVTLERPSQTFLWLLGAYPVFFPVPDHVVSAGGSLVVQPGRTVSNGAFMLSEWIPNGHIRLVKNPHFAEAGTVALDEVLYYPTDDDTAAVKRFRAGELDVNLRFPPSQYRMLTSTMPDETRVNPASWIGYLVMNQTDKRFADARVRRALSMAIDRETLVQRVLGNGELPAWSFIPQSTRGFTSSGAGDFSAMSMRERQDEARRLLAEAGYGPGSPLAFTFMHRIGEANKRAALSIFEMWKAVGIDVRIESNEVKVHYARLRQQQFDVADAGWSAPPDAEFFNYLIRTDSTDMNFGRWSNAEFDRLTDLGNRERDLAKRGGYYAAAEKIALDETAIIPVYIPVERALVQRWVRGFESNALNYHPSRWISIQR